MSRPDGKIVLVIEAAHQARDELAESLRRLGVVPIPVADPDSATVVIRSVRPDLVLWHGASGDATSVAAVAEWRGRSATVPIIAVVPASDPGGEELRRSGADLVLLAPLAAADLEHLVLRWLGSRDPRGN